MQYAKPKVYWLMLIGIIFSILNTTTSYADVTCDPGMIADNFAQTDYSSLAPNTSPPKPASNANITGTASESYLVTSNALTTSGNISGTNLYRLGTGSTALTSIPAFEFFQDFTDANSTRTVTYSFTNKFTGQPQPVSNLGLSVFDIDANFFGYDSTTRKYVYEFKDAVKVVGYDVNGAAVTPEVTFRGPNITNNNGSSMNYQNVYNRSIICTNSVADSNCQISYTFTTPIISLAITYGNDNVTNNISYSDSSRSVSGNPGDQAIFIHFDGYCYTPQPRLSLTKLLASNRIVDTDQFNVQVKDTSNNTVVSPTTNSTTSGSTNVVTTGTGTTGTFKVDPTKTYQLTEIAAGTTDLTKYAATYSCKKADGTTVTTLNPNSLNLTYGDNWTCTVTNSQRGYTFSGIVFNDNGGLTLANDLSVPVGTNTTYFNGVYDSSVETGITQTGLTIDLAKNCNTTTPTIIQSAIVGSDGTYSISATSTQMANATNVCLIQREPNGNLTSYPVDTTNNQANITFASTIYDYQNINFGEVSQNNAGLVLVKEQATNDCNITNTAMLGLTYNAVTQSGIDARKCVAYKITAYNRTNLTNGLTNVRITDALPKKGVNGSTVNSLLDNPLDTTLTNFKVDTANSVAIGANGTVVSDVQSLAKGASRSLYFNTKYDANSK
ncbi:hypothetical protein [Moraxella osloensis]|uniref:hypothetical protein n=1 Tax=Faucicola osloensis TaxID=34062 RepID=UPI00242F6C5A|nr:hypothetical protein [Moraxella osloensis]